MTEENEMEQLIQAITNIWALRIDQEMMSRYVRDFAVVRGINGLDWAYYMVNPYSVKLVCRN